MEYFRTMSQPKPVRLPSEVSSTTALPHRFAIQRWMNVGACQIAAAARDLSGGTV